MPPAQTHSLLSHIRRLAASQTTTALPDKELMRRLVEGWDEPAFEELVRRHGPMVLGVCQRVLGEPHDAEDAFQATFLVLMQKASSVRSHASVGSWLYGVAQRLARRAKVTAARRRAHERQATPRRQPDPLAEMTVQEARAAFEDTLARLPSKYRRPLVLCCLAGKTRDEAAQELGCSLNSLKSRLERARELMRQRLAGRHLTLSAAMLGAFLAESRTQAALPAKLFGSTIHLAYTARSGTSAAAALSPKAVALAQAWSKAMLGAKGMVGALLVLALGLIAAAGFAIEQGEKPQPADRRQKNTSRSEGANQLSAKTKVTRDQKPRPKSQKAGESSGFLIYPVTTDLQRELAPAETSLFVLVDASDAIKNGNIAPLADKLKDLRKQLTNKKTANAKLHFTLFSPTSSISEIENILRYAAIRMGHEIGYAKVTAFIHTSNAQTTWKELLGRFTGRDSLGKESPIGNDLVKIYPVRTELSRYFTDGSDCAVVVLPSLGKEKGTIPPKIRQSIKHYVARLKVTNKTKISFHLRHIFEASDAERQRLLNQFSQLATKLGFETSSVSFR